MGTRTINPARVALLVLATLAGGCQLVGGFETFEGDAAEATSTGGDEACPEGEAPGTGGPPMALSHRDGGGCFWIDETEVTVAEYAAFQASDPSNQTAECADNTSFVPECDPAIPTQGPDEPVVCVDWCDALAFCKSVGKRLCHGEGASNAANAVKSEWFAACSAGGATNYPYGPTYEADACNGGDNPETGCGAGTCSLVEVASLAGCRGAGGIADMSGNAAEWADECTSTAATGKCAARGGGANSDAAALGCAGAVTVERLTANKFIAFRCCADM